VAVGAVDSCGNKREIAVNQNQFDSTQQIAVGLDLGVYNQPVLTTNRFGDLGLQPELSGHRAVDNDSRSCRAKARSRWE